MSASVTTQQKQCCNQGVPGCCGITGRTQGREGKPASWSRLKRSSRGLEMGLGVGMGEKDVPAWRKSMCADLGRRRGTAHLRTHGRQDGRDERVWRVDARRAWSCEPWFRAHAWCWVREERMGESWVGQWCNMTHHSDYTTRGQECCRLGCPSSNSPKRGFESTNTRHDLLIS